MLISVIEIITEADRVVTSFCWSTVITDRFPHNLVGIELRVVQQAVKEPE